MIYPFLFCFVPDGNCVASTATLSVNTTLTYSEPNVSPETATVTCSNGYANVTSTCTGTTGSYAWAPTIASCASKLNLFSLS